MNEEELTFLISLYLEGTATAAQREKLLQWYRNQYPEGEVYIAESEQEVLQIKERVAQHLQTHIRPTVQPRRFTWWRAAAAAAAILVLAAFFIRKLQTHTPAPAEYVTVTNPAGKVQQIILPDSSRMWLNARSTARYPKAFLAQRTVILSGEAFFEVNTQAGHPFTVQTQQVITQVLGTSFNVKAYTTDSKISVAVRDGKVAVSNTLVSLGTLLPSQQIAYEAGTGASQITAVGAAAFSWKDGKLSFESASMADIARQLERWYDVTFEFKNPTLRTCTYSAAFDNTISLKELLTLLCEVNNIHFNIDNERHVVTLGGKGCN